MTGIGGRARNCLRNSASFYHINSAPLHVEHVRVRFSFIAGGNAMGSIACNERCKDERERGSEAVRRLHFAAAAQLQCSWSYFAIESVIPMVFTLPHLLQTLKD